MSNFVLSCCSTADLKMQIVEERDIKYVPFHYELGGIGYLDDLGQSVDYSEFYAKMVGGADTKTSQVNAEEYKEYFKQFLNEGKDILHVSLSSGISGTVNSANIAASELREEYPDRKIYIVDSLGASGGYGLMMVTLADMRDEGKSIDELYEFAENNKLKMHHWFFSTDLTFYIKGGRVSKTSGFVGTLLNICPLLNMDNMGRLIPRFKVRTKRKVIQETYNKMVENADGGLEYSGKCFVTHSESLVDAKALADMIEANFPNLNGKVDINYIGPTIGAHTGPGTVALFFWGKERED